MRISTNMIFNQGITSIQQQEANLVQTQLQLSSGLSVMTPADNPVAAAEAVNLQQTMAVTQQYTQTNASSATSSLQLEDNVLGSVTTTLQQIQNAVVQAGDGSLSSANLQNLGAEVQGYAQNLLSLANSSAENGQYMFAGYKGSNPPFVAQTNGNVTYQGDSGQQLVQASTSRQIPVSDPGNTLFSTDASGNVTLFDQLNTFQKALASGTTSSGSVNVNSMLNTLQSAMTQVLQVRASVGSRLQELSAVQATGQSQGLQYQTDISNLTSLDYAKAISNFTEQQTYLQAADKSYSQVTQLSLFSYI
ncbi:MAG: flagellar hook-associated protein FlgL [Betaproteobacteria bacterium]|nr:flagellar hook-associated protein FlgL [Betaproteobacteria bacterium]